MNAVAFTDLAQWSYGGLTVQVITERAHQEELTNIMFMKHQRNTG